MSFKVEDNPRQAVADTNIHNEGIETDTGGQRTSDIERV
jgi:hypothetical protein